jgi:hypothetical protein
MAKILGIGATCSVGVRYGTVSEYYAKTVDFRYVITKKGE